MRDDFRTAWRSLRSTGPLTIAALVVVTLGIGATTAVFSVVDAVVLRGLPFDEPDRIVAIGQRAAPGTPTSTTQGAEALGFLAPQNYVDLAEQQRVFEAIAAFATGASTLREPGSDPEDLPTQRVTTRFFEVFRSRPAVGRSFTAGDEIDGHHRVAILSDGLWRRRFGADPGVVGRAVTLDDDRYEIVGVMPREFEFPVASTTTTAIWVPYVVPPDERVRNPQRLRTYLQAIGRLAQGVSVTEARAQMQQIAASLAAAHPQWNRGTSFGILPLVEHIVGRHTRSWMLMLLGSVALLLAIACANIASLLLARATARGREVAVRAALGASRWRLMRQMLVESALLSAIGLAAGTLLAWWTVGLLRSSMPPEVPRVANIAIDARVLAAAAMLAVVTGVVCGIAPALRFSRPDLATTLKTTARGTAASGGRTRAALVVVEIALAVVLLVGAGLFIGSFAAVMRIDPGFDASNVLTAGVYPHFRPIGSIGAPPRDASSEFLELVYRLGKTPGVVHAAAVSPGVPLATGTTTTSFRAADRRWDPQERIDVRWVSADFHRALRIPLVNGRFFEPLDRRGSASVMIVNLTAARRYFPGQDPVGREVDLEGKRIIVGVVRDVRQTSLEVEPAPEAYIPIAQSEVFGAELVIRTSGDPRTVLAAARAATAAVLPGVPLRGARTMEEVFARRVAQRKLTMLLLGLFGVLALAISTAGVFGVMAHTVAQRTREIGVRMALGATQRAIVSMVLRTAAGLLVLGLTIGGTAAWYLSATAKAFLFQVEATDLRAFASAAALLALAALSATVLPARRAASVDPAVTLRAE